MDSKEEGTENLGALHGYRDSRSRIDRLLNYKRYIDWLIEKELTSGEPGNKKRSSSDNRRVKANAHLAYKEDQRTGDQ